MPLLPPQNAARPPPPTGGSSPTYIGGQTVGISTKNADATWWIPSEKEWNKAAYLLQKAREVPRSRAFVLTPGQGSGT